MLRDIALLIAILTGIGAVASDSAFIQLTWIILVALAATLASRPEYSDDLRGVFMIVRVRADIVRRFAEGRPGTCGLFQGCGQVFPAGDGGLWGGWP
jgi:hypothetical protein